MKKMSFNKRNLKYGGFSIVLTAFIVAAIIIINVAVTSLGSTFSWYTDLTGSSIYSVSDAFYDIIKGEKAEGKDEYDGIMGVNYDGDDKNDLYINVVLLMISVLRLSVLFVRSFPLSSCLTIRLSAVGS